MHRPRVTTIALAGLAAAALVMAPAARAASNNIVVTYAGNGQDGYSGDGGQATAAQIDLPSGVVLDNAANIFVADRDNNRIRKVNAGTVITTVAGTGARGFSGDNGPSTAAKLKAPTGVAVNGGGVLYIADTGNNRVRKVMGGVITTVAGNGSAGYAGDGGPGTQAQLSRPTGLALDGSGNLFIADSGNNVVRELTPAGTISTFAGKAWTAKSDQTDQATVNQDNNQGNSGDNNGDNNNEGEKDCQLTGNSGPATSAQLCNPTSVTASGSTVLISDTGNSQVRKVSGGIITDFAGTGDAGFSGDGGQATEARVHRPIGVSYDPLGDVYIVDAANFRIRQVTASGVISTFAGTGQPGYSGDNGPAELAKIRPLGGVSADATNVFFSDSSNNRVRRIHKGGPPPALSEASTLALAGSVATLLTASGVVSVRRRRRRVTLSAA